ncbi:COG4 transport protein-domain-containing protein [Lineolata rhizophorae]|uniref:Conserved oligomeric Golgi complex subunit 4 n=1 Tax=Lineolata rhizophorae TaxID=578093 RepID=A0A6A6P100_9PEZI|nr:COG4 transport protein-domain-containing protein [Lineolata rhizophorae]
MSGALDDDRPDRIHDANGAAHPDPVADVYRASSLAEIQAAMARLDRQEASVTSRLNALVASQKDLWRELGRLDLLRAQLGTQVVNTRAISNGMLSDAATTASRISGAVKRLELEQTNVKATLDVVEQVAELKACVLGVHGSMGAPQDWETAASYLNRASKIPPEVIDSSFAEEIVPTAEVPDPPRATLDAAAESLCGLFIREFDKAAKDGDGARVTRFFKLFPLIGRTDVGLDAYGRYVCHGVASRARTNLNSGATAQRKEGFFYANVLTKLFEHIAQIVDGHEPIVERHYGTGMMIKVIQRLQVEADVQGGIILDSWYDERSVDRKLTDIKSYAFSFLVQSFLPSQKGSSGAPRAGSPAKRDRAAGRTSEDDGINMKEIDGMLGESAIMLGRWSLYTRFLALKDVGPGSEDADGPLTMPQFLASSNLAKKVSKSLTEPFNAMTVFFFRRSVERAFQLDEPPAELSLNLNKSLGSNPPFITSAVDDVMYIVNQVLQRTLATSQRPVVSAVVPAMSQILGGTDFVGMFQRKMRDESYPKAVIQGGLPPEDKVIAFLVLLNNLDVATDYIKRIVSTHLGTEERGSGSGSSTEHLTNLFPFGTDAAFVASALRNMETAVLTTATELLADGVNVVFHQVMKVRMRPILADAFRDIDYSLTEAELSAMREELGTGSEDSGGGGTTTTTTAAANMLAHPNLRADAVPARFERGWNALTRPLRRILTERNYDRVLAASLGALARALEKRVWALYGRGVSDVGAARLERDVAGLAAAAVAGGRYGLRDAFARVVQMTVVMNLEEDEWEELGAGREDAGEKEGQEEAGIAWVLDREERVRARAIVRGRGER